MKAVNTSGLWKKHLGDWVLNPYVGCEHGCRFCYAPAMPGVKFNNGGRDQESWGTYLEPKFGIVEALRQQLRTFTPDKAATSSWGAGCILVSFLTDPYGPSEATHRLTRQCLQLLLEAGHKVRIQTRSPLVERDFDLLCSHRDQVLLGTSLPHLDSVLARAIEPHAPAPCRRLRMLESARSRGLQIYAAIAPVMPFHGEETLARVAGEISPFQPREVFCEVLNPKGSNLEMTRAALLAQFPREAEVLADYDLERWAHFTFRMLAYGQQNIPAFVPWPDTMRQWAQYLKPDEVQFLDRFLPDETSALSA